MSNGNFDVTPLALVRSFRATYTNLRRQPSVIPSPFPDRPGPPPPAPVRPVTVRDPATEPIDEGAMPEAARNLVAEYRSAHPGVQIEWERRMRADEAGPTLVVEDDRELPGEQELLTVGVTTTLVTSDTARVVTDVFVGRLRRQ